MIHGISLPRPERPVPALLVATMLTLLLGCSGGGEAPSEEATSSGSPSQATETAEAPRFRLASLEGEQVSPQDYEGEVVLIDFWATWCGPCHAQADILKGLFEEFGGKGVRFLAISLGEPEETVREFVERRPYPYPVLIDPEDELSLELGIYVLPTILVIDREGKVAYLEPGVSDAETLRRVLYAAGVEHPAIASSS